MAVVFDIGDGASQITIGRDLLRLLQLPPRSERRQVAVLHQPGSAVIAEEVAGSIRGTCTVSMRELPDRDEAKTWSTVSAVHAWLAELNLGRSDTIVGVGGGALTDVAGFVAATWLRGVEAVYVPTTMLAAVDAAIGGKTGINLAGKNLVGAFWHPSSVIVDLDVLSVLPPELKREGFAEVIKAGFLGAPEIIRAVGDHGLEAPLEDVVVPAVRVKADIVDADFRELGDRAFLNFGHTIGHGIEFASGCSHGDAVAIGMVAEAAVSVQRFGTDLDVRPVLERVGLPTATSADPAEVRRLIRFDKKRDRTGVRMVLLEGIGRPQLVHVTPDEIDLGLAAVGLGS